MTRDEARTSFTKSGLSYEDITGDALQDLSLRIDTKMKESGLIRGSYRMHKTEIPKPSPDGKRWASLRCKSFYFEDREAVTFNPDGFVGFAGWADDKNVQPILQGFTEWVEAMQPSPSARTVAP